MSSVQVYRRIDGVYSSFPVDSNPMKLQNFTPASQWVGFDLVGGDLSDASGNESDLVVNGTPGIFTDPTWATFNGTDQFLEIAAPKFLPYLLDMSTLLGEQIIYKAVLEVTDLAVVRTLFALGRNGIGSVGSLALQITTAEQIQLQMRGIDASSNYGLQVTAFDLRDVADFIGSPIRFVVSITGVAENTALVQLYVNGYCYGNIWNYDLLANGTEPTNADDTNVRFLIGARGNSSGESLHDLGKQRNVKIIRRKSINHLAVSQYANALTDSGEPEEITRV
jgi:hypothetical protein